MLTAKKIAEDLGMPYLRTLFKRKNSFSNPAFISWTQHLKIKHQTMLPAIHMNDPTYQVKFIFQNFCNPSQGLSRAILPCFTRFKMHVSQNHFLLFFPVEEESGLPHPL